MITIAPDAENRRGYVLHAETRLPRPLSEVFPFFADARNLEQLTPPWLQFHVVTPPPIAMFAGQEIDYRLRIHRVPVRWRTEIVCWDPPHHFVDVQLLGPYRYWQHEHLFEEVDGGTRCRDVVRYRVPGGALAHRLFVRRDIAAIFAYRQSVLHELFGAQPAAQSA